jgi:3-oxoacyl-(acyl-carrier-protein) synthase
MKRIGVFGWGVVAPHCENVDTFADRLEHAPSWLSPFEGFGPNNFLVGQPTFDLETYRPWIDERFPPTRYNQFASKMGQPTQYAVGAFIQSLRQNPGIEQVLQELGSEAHVYVGCGVGDIPTVADGARELCRAQRRWDRFWAQPENNSTVRRYLDTDPADREAELGTVPPHPDTADAVDRPFVEEEWWHYWAAKSPELLEYLDELRAIEATTAEGRSKIAVLKEKRARNAKLQRKWGAPEPPWDQVSANVIWNIHNTPASQISMLGQITGLVFAPVAACSTFGVALKLAMDAIHRGEAKAVVVGACDPAPHPLIVGAFYNARIIAADAEVSKPLTRLRGTHVSGGAVVWVVGDAGYLRERGLEPLGLEPLAVGVSADADHIITPSPEGPTTAIRGAFASADADPSDVVLWDLHATATPGDQMEMETLRAIVPDTVLVSARKGTFGHGLGAGGGWELTAQYLGFERGRLYPTPLSRDEVHPILRELHERYVFSEGAPLPTPGIVGKLSMGVGGINACILSRPW